MNVKSSIALAATALLSTVYFGLISAAPAEGTNCDGCLVIQKDAMWKINEIPVCWEKEDVPVAEADKVVVQDAVARTWAANSRLTFVGWQDCERRSKGIRISVRDTYAVPRVMNYGSYLNGFPDGMHLNFDLFKTGNWQRCSGRRDYCIEVSAVHEFGHALGFHHEQRRSDITDVAADCALDYPNDEAISNEWILGAYDEDSVMNYCNPTWGGYGELSALDKEGLTKVYGVGGS